MKKIIKIAAVLGLVLLVSVSVFEAQLSGAQVTDTDNVVVTLTVETGIAISDGADVTMSPNITSAVDQSSGGSSWTVTTNSALGYNLDVKATSSPALVSGSNSFTDYTEGTAGVPDAWSVNAGAYEFGFSAYGTDVEPKYGTGNACASPSSNSLNYEGLETTSKVIATRNTVTPTTGVETNICFAAEQNGVFAPSGTYQATIVATATTL